MYMTAVRKGVGLTLCVEREVAQWRGLLVLGRLRGPGPAAGWPGHGAQAL